QLRTKIHLSSWPRKSHDRSSSLDILSRVAGVPHRFGSVRRAIKNIEMRGYVSNYASSKAPRPAAVESTGQGADKLRTLRRSIDPSHSPAEHQRPGNLKSCFARVRRANKRD